MRSQYRALHYSASRSKKLRISSLFSQFVIKTFLAVILVLESSIVLVFAFVFVRENITGVYNVCVFSGDVDWYKRETLLAESRGI